MALAPVFAVEAAGQTSRMGWRRNAHRVGVGVADSHCIHAPRAQRRSLDNEGSLAQPFCVRRVDFLSGLDIEMEPHSRLALRLLDQHELHLVTSYQRGPYFR